MLNPATKECHTLVRGHLEEVRNGGQGADTAKYVIQYGHINRNVLVDDVPEAFHFEYQTESRGVRYITLLATQLAINPPFLARL